MLFFFFLCWRLFLGNFSILPLQFFVVMHRACFLFVMLTGLKFHIQNVRAILGALGSSSVKPVNITNKTLCSSLKEIYNVPAETMCSMPVLHFV